MKRNAFRARALAALALLASLSLACSDQGPAADAGAPAAQLAPIPAPPGLLAEITIPLPEATWKEVRLAVGGPALFLPQSIGGFMTTVLGLPITVAAELDGNLPALGAVIDAPERPQPYAAIGVHVRVGERLVDQLTKGEAARFTSKVDPASGVTELMQKGTVKGPVVMGVLGNYLLVGRKLADITAAGPYIARSLSKSPATSKEDISIEIPESALGGPLKRSLEGAQGALKRAGGTTFSLLPLDRITEKLVAIVPDLARARVAIDIDGPNVRLRISGSPKAGGGPASVAIRGMSAGDVAPLRALPEGTLVGVLDRVSASVRASGSESEAESFLSGVLEKLDKKDREAVVAALRSISDARGDWLAGGMSFASTGPLGYVRVPAPDEEKLTKAMKDLLSLLKRASIKAALKEQGFEVKVRKAVVEGVAGDVQRVTISRIDAAEKDGDKAAKAPAGAGAKENAKRAAKDAKEAKDAKDAASAPQGEVATSEVPTSIDIFYIVRKDGLSATVGYDAKEGLAGLLGASDGFGGVPEIKASLDALGDGVAFAVVADPLRLIASRAGKPGAAPSAPVVIALGRGGSSEELWLRLDVAVTAIQELVKHRGALSL